MGTYMSELCTGEKGTVTDIRLKPLMKKRLQDMGLIRGTEVICVGKSPLGDPSAYLIRRTVIALRNEDARQIEIDVGKGGESGWRR